MPTRQPKERQNSPWSRTLQFSTFIIAVGVLIGIAYYFLKGQQTGELNPQQATLILAAATISLTVVTVLVAVISFFGWQGIRERVEDQVHRVVTEDIQRIDIGLTRLSQGAVFGRFAEYVTGGIPEHMWPAYMLRTAIQYTRSALQDLQGTEHEYKATNNLAYYLALRGESADAPQALIWAKSCLESYTAENANPELLLTYGRVVAMFAREGAESPRAALRMLELAEKNLKNLRSNEPLDEVQLFSVEQTLQKLTGEKHAASKEVGAEAKASGSYQKGPLERVGAALDRLVGRVRGR